MALPEAKRATEAQYLRDSSDAVIAFQYRTNEISGTSYQKRGTLTVAGLTFTIQLTPGVSNPELSITVDGTGLTATKVVADTYNVWHDVRLVAQWHSGDISVPTAPTTAVYLYVDGTPEGPILTPTWHPGSDPSQQVQAGFVVTDAALDSEYGAHTDDTWYEHAAIGEQIEFRNIFVSVNGVVRYFDPCTDGFAEWSKANAPAYHSPRFGETLPMRETAAGLTLAPTALAYYNSSTMTPVEYNGYYPATAYNFRSYSPGYKHAHRMLHCVSGAEMRGWLISDREQTNVRNLSLFWPHYNKLWPDNSLRDPYIFETLSYWTSPRDDPSWNEPTLNNLGAFHRQRYAIDNPTKTLPIRLEDDGAGPSVTGGYWNEVYRPSERGSFNCYNAFDGDHDSANWHTTSGDGAGSYPHWCGQDATGRPVALAYEKQAGAFNVRWNPVLRMDSDNELASIRDDVIASEDATAAVDPVTGEVVIVAIQDTWASNAQGDFDVNLCTQRLGYDGGHDLGAPEVVATLAAADLDEAYQIADAAIDQRGRLWVAVWKVSSAGTGYAYSTMQALIYTQAAPGEAATLLDTLSVTRPPHNAAWLVWDHVADEVFFAYQDATAAQDVTVHRLPQLDTDATTQTDFTAGNGTLPTPPYGDWWGTTQPLPYRLLALWIDEAGRWRARWSYAEWFNAYDTVDVVIQALAADDSEADYHQWPNVYPNLTGDTRKVGPPPEFMEDIEETEADLHPLTGAATWSDRPLAELLQGAPA